MKKILYKTDDNGHTALILTGNIVDGLFKSDLCPFCGTSHTHSPKQSHRIAHCPTKKRKPVTAPDGTELTADDGYYLRVYFSLNN